LPVFNWSAGPLVADDPDPDTHDVADNAVPLVGVGMTTLDGILKVTAPVDALAAIWLAVPVIEVPTGAVAHAGEPDTIVRI
jgi:hypothetical protein